MTLSRKVILRLECGGAAEAIDRLVETSDALAASPSYPTRRRNWDSSRGIAGWVPVDRVIDPAGVHQGVAEVVVGLGAVGSSWMERVIKSMPL